MEQQIASLEPLADYLEPEFGNIYDCNFTVVDGFDVQQWTPELQMAVKRWLMHEVPLDLRSELALRLGYPEHDAGAKEKEIDALFESYEPWEIANIVRQVAVVAIPTLEALIGHLGEWPFEDVRWDASVWLAHHGTEQQLRRMATASGNDKDPPAWADTESISHTLGQALEPPELLSAWMKATQPAAATDLTDREWQLVAPLLPRASVRTRAALDGVLYWLAKNVSWKEIPGRYGTWRAVYQHYCRYKRSDIFARILAALRDEPEAARVVQMLDHPLARWKRRRRQP
jgi:transposase